MALDQTIPKIDDANAEVDDQQTPRQLADFWIAQISAAEKKKKKFITRGKKILQRYKNYNKGGNPRSTTDIAWDARRMNVLWSNVQTLKPVLYSQSPKANCSRRNKSNKDPVGRVAGMVLENVLQNSIAMEDFDHVMKQVIDDRLLPGVGCAMVEYRAEVEQDQIGWQAAETRYIHWEDWLTNQARTWQEVTWWGFRTFHSKREAYEIALADSDGDEEFAQHVRENITLDHTENKDDKDAPAKATIYTIWDSKTRKVYHIAEGYVDAPIGVLPAPVNFDGFLPVPRPLQATTTTDSTVPVPDFDQYSDQADEIDMLTQRIGGLTRSLKAMGIYAGDMESIKQLMEEGDNTTLIPVENWMMVMERGGLDKAISWFPLEKIAAALAACYDARDRAIQIMYEVTGISDIARGATDPNETASAQQLKAQFGGVRIRDSQREVQRIIRDLLRKKAEVIAEHFELQVIQKMSGVNLLMDQQKATIQQAMQIQAQREQQAQAMAAQAQQQGLPPPPPPPPMPPIPEEVQEAMKEPSWDQVMKLLRDEKLRGFVIDVETDSTIEPDQQAQQAAAVQFTTAVTQYLEAASQILMASPQAAPLLGEMLIWTTRQWKTADSIEGAIDEFVEQMEKIAQQPKPPTPEDQQAQADVEVAKIGVGVAQLKAQTEAQKAQIDQQTAQISAQAEQQKAAADVQATLVEHQTTMKEQVLDAVLTAQQHKQAMELAKAKPKPNGGSGA